MRQIGAKTGQITVKLQQKCVVFCDYADSGRGNRDQRSEIREQRSGVMEQRSENRDQRSGVREQGIEKLSVGVRGFTLATKTWRGWGWRRFGRWRFGVNRGCLLAMGVWQVIFGTNALLSPTLPHKTAYGWCTQIHELGKGVPPALFISSVLVSSMVLPQPP